jgi:hypothetical protein
MTITAATHTISITASGGCQFYAIARPHEDVDALEEFLGSFESGELDEDGQWEEGDESPGDVARKRFDLPEDIEIIEAF